MEYSIIGKMYAKLPTYDEEGNITQQGTLAEGFHVNARGAVPDAWGEYEIEAPVTPLRVYQGGGTQFFVFPNKDLFEGTLPEPSQE